MSARGDAYATADELLYTFGPAPAHVMFHPSTSGAAGHAPSALTNLTNAGEPDTPAGGRARRDTLE